VIYAQISNIMSLTYYTIIQKCTPDMPMIFTKNNLANLTNLATSTLRFEQGKFFTSKKSYSVWFELPFAAGVVPTCARLMPLANGRLQCSRGNEVLSRCALKCNSRFVPVGTMVQWCLPDAENRMMWHLQVSNSSYKTSASGGVVQCRCECLSKKFVVC